MRWRSRILFTFIIYFSGFATAIYTIAPANGETDGQRAQARSGWTSLQNENVSGSEKFAQVFNSGMRKYLSFAEEKAVEIGRDIKARFDERREHSEE